MNVPANYGDEVKRLTMLMPTSSLAKLSALTGTLCLRQQKI